MTNNNLLNASGLTLLNIITWIIVYLLATNNTSKQT